MKLFQILASSLLIASITTGIAEGAPDCTEWAGAQIEAKADRYAQYKAEAADSLDTVTAILADEGLPPKWAYLMLVESGGDPQAKSHKGAAGLWQLTAATARAYGCTDRTDTETSTRAAARYITHLLVKFDGDEWKAIAAFNMGGHNLKKHGATREARALADIVTCLFYRDPFFLDGME